MSEKRFSYGETIDYNFFDVFEEKKYLGMVQRDSTKIVDRLNELAEENEQLKQKVDFYKYFQKDARELEKKNEQLRKQIQNYEQLIANSYVGIEETLDGFVGKYVIWEDELQKYRKKNKKVMKDE